MAKYIMSLDQGTTSSRCIIFNHKGQIISMAHKEFTQIYPQPGYVEHNPEEIWGSQLQVIKEAMDKIGCSYIDIDSIGITNQRETTIMWDKLTGEPVYNAIVWQCRRTADLAKALIKEGHEEYIKKTTGLLPDAYFSATKIKWILDNVKGVREKAEKGEILFGNVDTWLMYKLTNGEVHKTDYTNASRTMLFDINNLNWDEKILDILNIPKSILPKVCPSSYYYGDTYETILGGKIKICGVAGDQQAALFGQTCFEPGDAKNTYGTGCFLLMNTEEKAVDSKNGLITTIAASTSDKIQYAIEGSVFVAGAAVQWLRDEMKLINSAAETQECALKVTDTNGVYVVPAFTGLGAPYWDPYAKGGIYGITRGVNKDHIIRATLEAIAYQTYDVIKAMEKDADISLKSLKVDGGASANEFLMKFQADILGIPVLRPAVIETTALGAAYLAGLETKYFESIEEIKENYEVEESFLPDMSEDAITEKINGWHDAVRKTMITI